MRLLYQGDSFIHAPGIIVQAQQQGSQFLGDFRNGLVHGLTVVSVTRIEGLSAPHQLLGGFEHAFPGLALWSQSNQRKLQGVAPGTEHEIQSADGELKTRHGLVEADPGF